MLETPSLLEPSDDHLRLISSKVIIDRDFREKIGGNSLVPNQEREFLFWKNYNSEPTRKIVLAYAENKIIGFYALDEINQGARNARAHVHIWEQSKHLPALCERFLAHCKNEIGLYRLWGMTSADNLKAWKFAQRVGFKSCGLIPNFYRNLNGFSDAIISDLNLYSEELEN